MISHINTERKETTVDKKEIIDAIEKVVYRLMNLGGADYSADKSNSSEDTNHGVIARDWGIEEWDWPQGVGLYGLTKLQSYYKDNRYDEFLDSWFQRNLKIGLPSININTTAPFLALMDLVRRTGNKQYEKMCLERAEWLMNDLPKTHDGGFQHVTSAVGDRNGVSLNENQIWVDTLFMAVMFLNQAGQYFNRPDFVDESVKQFLIHIKYLYEKTNGLFHHGWTFDGMNNFGGVFWCRGNSWFTYGVIDYLAAFDKIPCPEGVKKYLVDTFSNQAEALAKLQDPSGLWHTVLDDETSYVEASGSGAITAGIAKGVKLGILPEKYRANAENGIKGLIGSISEDGTVLNVSAGTPVGMNKDHYRSIIVRPMAYGQSLTLLALVEALDL